MEQTKLRLTVEEIVEETVAYIEKNGQALDHGSCVYLAPDGNKCAFGRCMDMRRYKEDFEGESCETLVSSFELDSLDILLKKRYRGLPIEFWSDLQELHDNSSHWLDGNLSRAGEAYVTEIIDTYGGI